MRNTNIASLKIDFKIETTITGEQIIRIIDIGNGLSAGRRGFPNCINAKIVRDLYDESGASAIVSPFGEMPRGIMLGETVDIPFIPRTVDFGMRLNDVSDLAAIDSPVLILSEYQLLSSYVAYAWQKNFHKVITPSMSFLIMEKYKSLWYMLMQLHLPSNNCPTILYWCNHDPINLSDLEKIHAVPGAKGVFIKIGEESKGYGQQVYYAKNLEKTQHRLQALQDHYALHQKKHQFIIEPAYLTLRDQYNVTGRAFITLRYDQETNALNIKIAGAKWIAAPAVFDRHLSSANMLANFEHMKEMIDLDDTDLEILSRDLTDRYGNVFRQAFLNDPSLNHHIMQCCNTHPSFNAFYSCLKDESFHKVFLKSHCPDAPFTRKKMLAESLCTLVRTKKILGHLESILSANTTNLSETLLESICYLSFMAQYINFLKAYDNRVLLTKFPEYTDLIQKSRRIELKINALMVTFLKNKGIFSEALYDVLKQACNKTDLITIRLLIYTRRAQVELFSKEEQAELLGSLEESAASSELKTQVREILHYAGLKDSSTAVLLSL